MAYDVPQKQWNNWWGNLIPQVEHSEGNRPHVGYVVAPWLPLDEAGGVHDKEVQEYFSVMAGKPVAVSRDGYVVPAGLLVKILAAAGGDTIFAYSQTDVDERVMDIETGTFLTAAKTVTKTALENSLQSRGILRSGESVNNFISNPVGVAPYPYYNCFASDPDDPTTMRKHNTRLQDRVAILCDYVLILAWVPEQKSAVLFSSLGDVTQDTSQTNTWYVNFTNTVYMPIAANLNLTSSWAFATDNSNYFVEKVWDKRSVSQTGRFLVDSTMNRVYFYHTGNTAAATAAVHPVIPTFYHYNSTSDTGSNKYARVIGPIKPGDYLKPTTKSNWEPVNADGRFTFVNAVGTAFDQTALQAIVDEAQAAIREQAMTLGQVLAIDRYPQSALEYVRSNKGLGSSLVLDSMPGNATEGVVDRVTYPGGADSLVVVNIINK